MAVLAIKAMSRGGWPEGMERTRKWWYRSVEEPQEVDLAMRFALSQPGRGRRHPAVVPGPAGQGDRGSKAIPAHHAGRGGRLQRDGPGVRVDLPEGRKLRRRGITRPAARLPRPARRLRRTVGLSRLVVDQGRCRRVKMHVIANGVVMPTVGEAECGWLTTPSCIAKWRSRKTSQSFPVIRIAACALGVRGRDYGRNSGSRNRSGYGWEQKTEAEDRHPHFVMGEGADGALIDRGTKRRSFRTPVFPGAPRMPAGARREIVREGEPGLITAGVVAADVRICSERTRSRAKTTTAVAGASSNACNGSAVCTSI